MDMEITMAMHCHVKRGMRKVAKGTDDECDDRVHKMGVNDCRACMRK